MLDRFERYEAEYPGCASVVRRLREAMDGKCEMEEEYERVRERYREWLSHFESMPWWWKVLGFVPFVRKRWIVNTKLDNFFKVLLFVFDRSKVV
ncbi:hypothetical protein LCM20_10030 [Halobacillus litoralis]|uniref:hypothetical protein n=1 Tax=Halobacillus litoralis TaxID=45668 RepID=UPI001CD3209A|nr:hypothetical protein [Halobacillus litoralis]MCA0970928.1 hypothetical protein [Halobacillus litoralis]